MSLWRRFLALPIAVVLAGAVLAGCAPQPRSAPSASADDDAGARADMDAAWLDHGRIIGLVTKGSSGCVPAADEATLQADGSLAVTLVGPDADTVCTADVALRVTLVDVPAEVDPAEDLAITVRGEGYAGSVELKGVVALAGDGMADYVPSAGWTRADGRFVLLTWGSSSCAPVIADVVASGPTEVTVTFETPPADRVCTMDMAPRATLVFVEGLDQDSDVELVLTGTPELDGVRIPIYGEG